MTMMDRRFVWGHVARAGGSRGRIPRYVAGLGLGDCAAILAAGPTRLPSFAALPDDYRVRRPEETRSFEEVIRAWTAEVFSELEGE